MKINKDQIILFILIVVISTVILFYLKWAENIKHISNYPAYIYRHLSINKPNDTNKDPNYSCFNENNIDPRYRKDDNSLIDYKNEFLGFSIEIPRDTFTAIMCPNNKPNNINNRTPIKVIEDNKNGVVYIGREYYYRSAYDQNKQDYVGECQKILNTFQDQVNEWGWWGWKIIINDITDEKDIDKYIAKNFGEKCIANCYNTHSDGILSYSIKSSVGWSEEDNWGGCDRDFAYRILYSPQKHKMMSVILGQECSFDNVNPGISGNESIYRCYDDEMINSFNFE